MTDLIRFDDVDLAVIARDGQQWFTTGDIARALGFADARKVANLYARNASEFTDSMTCVLKLRTQVVETGDDQSRDVRVFTLRGAHLVAMLARTPRARAFRAWALDLIEAELARLRDPGRGRDAVTAQVARVLFPETPGMEHDEERLAERHPDMAPMALRQLVTDLRSAEHARDRLLRSMALDEGDGLRIDWREAPSWRIARLTVEQRTIEDLQNRINRVARLMPAADGRS